MILLDIKGFGSNKVIAKGLLISPRKIDFTENFDKPSYLLVYL